MPDGRGGITCELACPSPRPSHVCSPLTFPCDGAGALRSSQPSLLVVLAPLWSSGAAGRPAQTSGANGRCVLLCGRRAGPSLCSLVMAPRSRCVAFLGLWCMVHGAEDFCKRPKPTGPNRTLLCGQECCFGAFGGVWNACMKRNTKSSYAWPPAAAASRSARLSKYKDPTTAQAWVAGRRSGGRTSAKRTPVF